MTTAPALPRQEARASRLGYVDDLRVALTIGVITAHAAIIYGAAGSFFYREAGDDPDALGIALTVPLGLGSMFGMGLFFFLAGAFTPAALQRKGPRRFLADRWLRLGIPFAVFVLAVVPLTQWLADAGSGEDTSAGAELRTQLGDLDAGPLWFVGVLLLFSTVYALVVRDGATTAGGRKLTGGLALRCMAGVAVASFLLRLVFPLDSSQVFAAHVWQWGQCAGLFALGLHAGTNGWFTGIPAWLRRRSAVALALGSVVVAVMTGLYRDDLEPLFGGLTWESVVVSTTEGVMATAAALFLTDLFRNRRGGRVAEAAGRAAYGAYVVQAPVLVAIAVLLRDSPLPPLARFAVVAVAAVLACFVVAAALRRIPGVRGIL